MFKRSLPRHVLAVTAGGACVLPAHAALQISVDQPASLLLRQEDPAFLYDSPLGIDLVSSIRTVTTTPDGGFLVNAKAGVSFGDFYSQNPLQANLARDHILGDVDGQTLGDLQTEDPSAIINVGGTDYARVQFSNAIGYNPANGNLVYGADIDLIPDAQDNSNRLDAIFVGDTPAIVQGDALPTGNGFAGGTSTGLSFVGSAGDTAYYKAGFDDGVATDGSGLFSTAGDVLLYTGQSLGASGNSIQDKDFAIGNTNFSDDGSFYITDADVGVGTAQGALVINGQVATTPTGTFFREGDPIVAGGTELLDSINQVAISNSGKWAASGWTDAATAEDGIFIDGELVFREGDVLPKVGGGSGAALVGLPQYVDVNNDGDVAFFFGGSGTGGIVLNGEVVVEVGDAIGGETFTKFAVSPIALSDRGPGGVVNLYFEAVDTGVLSIGTADTNSFGLYHIALAVVLPGDADGDGDVDDTDLGIAISNFTGPGGSGKTLADGDTDGDGDVDDTDLGVMISGFTGPLAPAAVPEPASALLTLVGLLACARRRRG